MKWILCRFLLLVLACLVEAGSRHTWRFLALRALSRLVWIWHALCQLGVACVASFCVDLYGHFFFCSLRLWLLPYFASLRIYVWLFAFLRFFAFLVLWFCVPLLFACLLFCFSLLFFALFLRFAFCYFAFLLLTSLAASLQVPPQASYHAVRGLMDD